MIIRRLVSKGLQVLIRACRLSKIIFPPLWFCLETKVVRDKMTTNDGKYYLEQWPLTFRVPGTDSVEKDLSVDQKGRGFTCYLHPAYGASLVCVAQFLACHRLGHVHGLGYRDPWSRPKSNCINKARQLWEMNLIWKYLYTEIIHMTISLNSVGSVNRQTKSSAVK